MASAPSSSEGEGDHRAREYTCDCVSSEVR